MEFDVGTSKYRLSVHFADWKCISLSRYDLSNLCHWRGNIDAWIVRPYSLWIICGNGNEIKQYVGQ